jgi:hypothetical protein
MAFLPADYEPKADGGEDCEEEPGMIILKVLKDGEEEQLVTLDSEEELESVYEQFMESLYEDEEDE